MRPVTWLCGRNHLMFPRRCWEISPSLSHPAVNEIVGGGCNHQNGSKRPEWIICLSLFVRMSCDGPSSVVLSNSTCLFVNQQPRLGRPLLSCPWSARSSLMWYGRVILDLLNGNDSPFLRNACTPLLIWGSLSSWGDNHTCRCHTWEGPHAHCGLFGYFCYSADLWKPRFWVGFNSLVFFQRQNRRMSSCFRRSPRSVLVCLC